MKPSIYTRPNKPKTMTVTKRREAPAMAFSEIAAPIEVHATTECHITPPNEAARMVEYLDLEVLSGSYLVLEPSAGTGALLDALFNAGHSASQTVAIEQNQSLCKAIQARFKNSIQPVQTCFLEYAADAVGRIEYPRIIMNPPFKDVRKHMNAALSLLGRSGQDSEAVLVALVPITYEHEEAETMEILPNTTFTSAVVNTKIIRIMR